jgi:osmotically-inducible protein OsmY
MARIDEEIKKDIVDSLYWDDRVDASNVTVEVKEGSVFLNGSVPSLHARMAAEQAAFTTAGVIEVQNDVIIRYLEATEMPSDAQLAAGVKDTLLLNPDIDSTELDVEVENGIVRLRGTLSSFWKKEFATDLAGLERGVLFVENHIAVVPTMSIVDQSIADDIESALERNALIDAEDVTVKVENGKVLLTGELPTWSARRAADQAARFTAGVIDLGNRITVAYP